MFLLPFRVKMNKTWLLVQRGVFLNKKRKVVLDALCAHIRQFWCSHAAERAHKLVAQSLCYIRKTEKGREKEIPPQKKEFLFFFFLFFTPILYRIKKKTSRSVWTGPTNGEPKHFQIIIKTKESFGQRDLCWRCFGCCDSMLPSSGCSSSVFLIPHYFYGI